MLTWVAARPRRARAARSAPRRPGTHPGGADFCRGLPGSPDVHKVVEHVIGLLKRLLNKALREDATLCTMKQYKKKAEQIFNHIIKTSGIQKDIASLPSTYEAVLAAGGGWAPPKKR